MSNEHIELKNDDVTDIESDSGAFRFHRRDYLKSMVAAGLLVGVGAAATPVAATSHELSVTSLDSGTLTPQDLAQSLLAGGSGITISNVNYIGDLRAGGKFSGGSSIVGIGEGVILSSGRAVDVVGPNNTPSMTTNLGTPGDAALDAISGGSTFNATVLEFDFDVPAGAEKVFFKYVFGSEEYNEYVGSSFNDVFAFFVNGTNVALVPDPNNPGGTLPAAINSINNGRPGLSPVNPDLYINNDPFNPDNTGTTVPQADLRNTQMDGLTVVLNVEAAVNPASTNTLRLAIADKSDSILDSWVLIEGGSLTITPPCQTCESSSRVAKYEFSCVETDPVTGSCTAKDFVLEKGDDSVVSYQLGSYVSKEGEKWEPVSATFDTEYCLWAVVKAGRNAVVQELAAVEGKATAEYIAPHAISFVDIYCTEAAAQAALAALAPKAPKK